MSDYRVELQFDHVGYKCVVIIDNRGYRCGYVGINNLHPLYAVHRNDTVKIAFISEGDYTDIITKTTNYNNIQELCPVSYFRVHGDLTYSDGGVKSTYPIESNLWWLGYDCNHGFDSKIIHEITDDRLREVEYWLQAVTKGAIDREVRSLDYCIAQCEKLAEQLLWIESREKVEVDVTGGKTNE